MRPQIQSRLECPLSQASENRPEFLQRCLRPPNSGVPCAKGRGSHKKWIRRRECSVPESCARRGFSYGPWNRSYLDSEFHDQVTKDVGNAIADGLSSDYSKRRLIGLCRRR